MLLYLKQPTYSKAYLNMPRGNRKENLSTRLARLPNRGVVPESEIPGTSEWNHRNKSIPINTDKMCESFFEGYSHEERQHYLKNCIPRTVKHGKFSANERLIDNINRWIDENGWQYIEGGEYDGSWVNPQYPNRIFQGNAITLPITGGDCETVEFPVANHEEDTIGLALRFEVYCAGEKMNIIPNRWRSYDSSRKGRKQVRSNKRRARRQKRGEAYAEAYNIKNPEKSVEAVATLKAQFNMEDVHRERAKMGIENDA